MSQSITIKIAGKDYPLVASTPDMERRMRLAADEIASMLAKYDERFPDKAVVDKLAFVTLNVTVAKMLMQEKSQEFADEAAKLEAGMEAYLKGIEENR